MLEINETSPARDLKYGHMPVGTTAARVTPNSVKLVRGVLLRAPGASDLVPNTDIVFVGHASVTPDYSATGGIPLIPGAAFELPIDDPSVLYAVSLTTGQDLIWVGV